MIEKKINKEDLPSELVIEGLMGSISEDHSYVLHSNDECALLGKNLLLVGEGYNVGVFFTSIKTKEDYKVQEIIENTYHKILFKVPTLFSGLWNITVVSDISKREGVKQLVRSEVVDVLIV